jgi:TRAP-type C4-dicarboxylate transport system permease large subunit
MSKPRPIVHGFLTETSIHRIFLAGLIPSLLLTLGFMLVTTLIRRSQARRRAAPAGRNGAEACSTCCRPAVP